MAFFRRGIIRINPNLVYFPNQFQFSTKLAPQNSKKTKFALGITVGVSLFSFGAYKLYSSTRTQYSRPNTSEKFSDFEVGLDQCTSRWISWEKRQCAKTAPHSDAAIKENDQDGRPLVLRLYQYESCPFCCKVRAYLDARRIRYEIVEVNSIFKQQLTWSIYQQVPQMLVVAPIGCADDDATTVTAHLVDSSLIISFIESLLTNRKIDAELRPISTTTTADQANTTKQIESEMTQLARYYPATRSTDQYGKERDDFHNKYFLMKFADAQSPPTKTTSNNNKKQKDEESAAATKKKSSGKKSEEQWRFWVDDVFVHMLPPNIYRTPGEARDAFRWVSECADWPSNFGRLQSEFVVNSGALVMYLVGKRLRKRYRLDDDVRSSLYTKARIWTEALGDRKFMSAANQNAANENEPDLSDLAMYGVLTSIRGCKAFQDLMEKNAKLKRWFHDVETHIYKRDDASKIVRKNNVT